MAAVEGYLTMSGNLTAEPKSDVGPSGVMWAKIRLASTTRVFDKAENQWRDGDTVFIDVKCWRRLAENVVATLQRGDRVLVSGRLRQREYDDPQGVHRTVTEIEAESVGPDLNRCAARLVRSNNRQTAAPEVAEEAASDEPLDESAHDAIHDSTHDMAPDELTADAGIAA
jgi:single-strand DNA-binding protein